MFVTSLTKFKPYRKFILETFPKPSSQTLENSKQNINPSLTGNFIELYIRLLTNSKLGFRRRFNDDLIIFKKNIHRLTVSKSMFQNYGSQRLVSLPNSEFAKAIDLTKSHFSKEQYFFRRSDRIRRITVSAIDPFRIYKFYHETKFPILIEFSGNPFVLYNGYDISKFHERNLQQLEKAVLRFKKNSIVTSNLILRLLHFCYASSQWFIVSPISNLIYDKSYINYLKNICKSPILKKTFTKQNVKYKPDISWQNIRARPDFLSDNKIIEIKCKNKFLDTSDYIQAVTYLLFSKQRSNFLSLGNISSLEMIYPHFNNSFLMNSKDFTLSQNDRQIFKKLIKQFQSDNCSS